MVLTNDGMSVVKCTITMLICLWIVELVNVVLFMMYTVSSYRQCY